MVAPPVLTGAVNVTDALALPAVAVPIVGAPGALVGVTEEEATDAGDVPALFVAVTVKVYAVPLLKPLTVIGLALPLPVMLLGDEVTV